MVQFLIMFLNFIFYLMLDLQVGNIVLRLTIFLQISLSQNKRKEQKGNMFKYYLKDSTFH